MLKEDNYSPLNYNKTATLTQYNVPANGIKPNSFSVLSVEILNANDWAIFKTEAFKTLCL